MSLANRARLLTTSAASSGFIGVDNLNQNVVKSRYAVRSEIAMRANVLAKQLADGDQTLPFKSVIPCNIGNPHAVLSQRPLTYIRQVLSLCMYPDLLELDNSTLFPADTRQKARHLLDNIPGGVGAYSNSQGLEIVRETIAQFLTDRDGVSTSIDEIFCSKGASEAVKMTLECLMRDSNDGVLVPVPQYPLYSATLSVLGAQTIGYFLNEKDQWSQSATELSRAYDEAVAKGVHVRALVVINPGNPTGQILARSTIEDIISFCVKRKLVLMADEVYANNVYVAGSNFFPFRQAAQSMPGAKRLQLISYNSVSKGFMGECGLRGGYMHLHNFSSEVRNEFTKLASMSLCSNTIGQLAMALHLDPPVKGQPSFPLYNEEREEVIDSLRRRAIRMSDALNSVPGMSCTVIQGAMYAFPRIMLSKMAIDAALSKGLQPDEMYVKELLEATGIVCVPGSGFLQEADTFHFRITILPPEDQIDEVTSTIPAMFRLQFSVLDVNADCSSIEELPYRIHEAVSQLICDHIYIVI